MFNGIFPGTLRGHVWSRLGRSVTGGSIVGKDGDVGVSRTEFGTEGMEDWRECELKKNCDRGTCDRPQKFDYSIAIGVTYEEREPLRQSMVKGKVSRIWQSRQAG